MAFIGTDLTAAQKTGLAQDRYLENRLLEMIKLEKTEFPFQMLGKDYVIPANQGTKIVQFRRYLALPQFASGHALIDGIAPTQPLLTEAVTVSATVAQYGAFMRFSDVEEAIHIDNIKSIYQPELARHAAELIERDVMDKIINEASIYFAGGLTSGDALILDGNNKLTWNDLRKVALYMKTQLRSGSAKANGKPMVVVHPSVMQDLLDEAAAMNHVFAAGQDNAPIKIGTLSNFQLYGIIVQEALISKVIAAKDVPGIANTTFAALETKILNGPGALNDVVYNVATDATGYYKCTTAGAAGTAVWAAITTPADVYVSVVLGKDPYIVTTLANGSVQFKMTGYEATKDDPLGQFSTVGYKLWTGAKVIDPIAIYAVYSFSGFAPASVTVPNGAYVKDVAEQAVNYLDSDGKVVTV